MVNRCKKCKYYAGRYTIKTCDYLLITGTPRGCDDDENCDKFKKKGKK